FLLGVSEKNNLLQFHVFVRLSVFLEAIGAEHAAFGQRLDFTGRQSEELLASLLGEADESPTRLPQTLALERLFLAETDKEKSALAAFFVNVHGEAFAGLRLEMFLLRARRERLTERGRKRGSARNSGILEKKYGQGLVRLSPARKVPRFKLDHPPMVAKSV